MADAKLDDMGRDIAQNGRHMFATAAVPTGLSDGGTSAGVGIFPRRYLESLRPCDQSLQLAMGNQDAGTGRWIPHSFRLRGLTITLIVLYLHTGENLSDRNCDILFQILEFMRISRGPFILVGDFQMSPDILAGSTWFQRANLQFAIPHGLTATCTPPRGDPSLIDYFLVSAILRPLICVQAVFDVPWKTHIGLRMLVHANPRSVLAPSILEPRPLPSLPVGDEGDHEFQQSTWDEAVVFSKRYLDRKSPVTRVVNLSEQSAGSLHPAQLQLAQSFSWTCLTMEVYTCMAAGISTGLTPYLGRGQFCHFRLRPIVYRTFKSSKYSCPSCNFWSTVQTCLHWLVVTSHDLSNANFVSNISLLKSLSASISEHWSSKAAPNCPIHAWRKWLDDLTPDHLVNSVVGYTGERVKVWESRASAQKYYRVKAASGNARKLFSKWIHHSLKHDLRALHSVVNPKSTPLVHASDLQSHFVPWLDTWAATYCIPHLPLGACVDWAPWKEQLSALIDHVSLPEVPGTGDIAIVFCPDQFRFVAKHYPAWKTSGSDFINVSELRDQPQCIIENFCHLLNMVHAYGAWPPQLQLNLFSLIPKDTGGSRPIAKTPIMYRLWCCLRSSVVKQWAVSTCPTW